MASYFGLDYVKGPVTVNGKIYKGRAAAFRVADGVEVMVICGSDEEIAAVAEGLGINYDTSKTQDVVVGNANKVT